MLKVVLADDDFIVREILKDSINWTELGMTVSAAAADGQEALDYCLEIKPDILLADIRMPNLSGLDVTICLREHGLDTRVIFVSGIHDFDYARTAVNIHAAGYILKPIRLEEVTAALKKVHDEIEMEFNREQVLRRMKENLDENIPLTRDLFLHNLTLDILENDEDLDEKLEYLDLPFCSNAEVVAAEGEIDNYRELIRDKSERDIHLFNFTIKGFIDRVLKNYRAGGCFTLRDGVYFILFNDKYTDNYKISLVFDNIISMLSEFGGLTMSAGIGNCVNSLRLAHLSYKEADSALKSKFFTGPGSLIHFDDIAAAGAVAGEIRENTRLLKLRKMLLEQLCHGEERRLREILDEYYPSTGASGLLSREYIRGQFLELIIASYQEFCKTEGEVPEIFDGYVEAMRTILQAETVLAIENRTTAMLLKISRYFNVKYHQRTGAAVARIKNYIIKMRDHNISLADIANEAYMSPSYMCAVFKRETGQTLNEFIIEDKMNFAKDLLINTRMKIFEVAQRLGYEAPHYFSYSFKHYTGQTPQQFRSAHGREDEAGFTEDHVKAP
jgi:two-component system response regulator YesN